MFTTTRYGLKCAVEEKVPVHRRHDHLGPNGTKEEQPVGKQKV